IRFAFAMVEGLFEYACVFKARRRASEADWTSLLLKGLFKRGPGVRITPPPPHESPASSTSSVQGFFTFVLPSDSCIQACIHYGQARLEDQALHRTHKTGETGMEPQLISRGDRYDYSTRCFQFQPCTCWSCPCGHLYVVHRR